MEFETEITLFSFRVSTVASFLVFLTDNPSK